MTVDFDGNCRQISADLNLVRRANNSESVNKNFSIQEGQNALFKSPITRVPQHRDGLSSAETKERLFVADNRDTPFQQKMCKD